MRKKQSLQHPMLHPPLLRGDLGRAFPNKGDSDPSDGRSCVHGVEGHTN